MSFFSKFSLRNRIFLLVGSLLIGSILIIWLGVFPHYEKLVIQERMTIISEQQQYAVENADRQLSYWAGTVRYLTETLASRPEAFESTLKNEIALNPDIIKVRVLALNTNEELEAQNTNYPRLNFSLPSLEWYKLKAIDGLDIAYVPKSDSLPAIFTLKQQIEIDDTPFSLNCFFDASAFQEGVSNIPIGKGLFVRMLSPGRNLFETEPTLQFPDLKNIGQVTSIKAVVHGGRKWQVLIAPFSQAPFDLLLAVPESLIAQPAKQLLFFSSMFAIGIAVLMIGVGWAASHQVTKPVMKLAAAVEPMSQLDFSQPIKKPELPELISLYEVIEAMRGSLDRYKKLNVEKLIVEEWKNRFLMTYTPDMIAIGDENGKFTFKNKRFSELLQELQLPETLTKNDFFSIPSMEINREVHQEEEIKSFHLKMRQVEFSVAPAETIYHFALQDVALFSEQKESKGFLMILHDLTNERDLERIKLETLGIIVHELRSPLMGIIGFSDLMLSQEYEHDTRKQYLEAIYKSGSKLSDLVDRFLNVLRMESGQMDILTSPVQLIPIVESLVLSLDAQAQKKSVKFVCTYESEIPEILASEELMREALQNLMTNAIKYGGKNRTVEITLKREDNFVIFSITDYGYGIPPEAQDKLFTKFYRVENEKTKNEKGTGLGLAYVKEIVTRHHGKITLESRPEIGCCFTITLPVGNMASEK
ncbi:integral membrane sensor signal transduction histidine kinase [Chloroherpeton thalassium ATCC 35110]|uniref:histidine kinase n=1 Tax=Chloroherpeton thalassium (strain ATCC 35110 / GB-78) TaxID=517418 RepID=B3QS45_CHLT3|nr:HAMP domain-containing sensor histidine kinase [Chloroherpeton thalassium]ACF13990.1 integral membrane sensor signal transduction histidine kinase [Chloroherpeton thalassium ATCC 35110]